jgi:hypothetical protein
MNIGFIRGDRKPRTLLAYTDQLTDQYIVRREFTTNDGRMSFIDRTVNGSIISSIGDHTIDSVAQKAQMNVGHFYALTGSGKSFLL